MEKYLELALSQATATQTYWDFYLFVLVAVLGFIATVKLEVIKQPYVRGLVALLFIAFTLSNLFGMDKNHDRREILVGIAYSQIADDNKKIEMKKIREQCNQAIIENQKIQILCLSLPPERLFSIIFHLFFDFIIFFLIVFSFKIREKLINKKTGSI